MRRERVGVPGRAGCRARPRRGPAARARPGGVRDPDERVAGADARDRRTRSGWTSRAGGLRAVGALRHRGRSADARRRRHARRPRVRGETVAEVPARLARRRRARVRPADRRAPGTAGVEDAIRRSAVRRRTTAWTARRPPRAARLAERGEQALGVGAVRLDRAGRHGAASRRRRGARADRGDAEGARVVDGRQGSVRRAGPVPRRGARGRRGRAQRRLHRRAAARDHELPQLRQPRAARGDVAVRRVDPRDARRVPRAGDAGHRRQRQLLQRVGRLGDLADAGGRHARAARGHRHAGRARLHRQRVDAILLGRDVRRARRERVRRGRRRGRGRPAGARPRPRGGAPGVRPGGDRAHLVAIGAGRLGRTSP